MAAPADVSPWVIVAGGFHPRGGMDRANAELAAFLASAGTPVHLVAHEIDASLTEHRLVTPAIRVHVRLPSSVSETWSTLVISSVPEIRSENSSPRRDSTSSPITDWTRSTIFVGINRGL